LSKDRFITIRASVEEKELLKKLSEENNMTISRYVLHAAKEKAAAEDFIRDADNNDCQISFFDAGKTKFCRICGNELTVDSVYCERCGAKKG
jgi:uncharacterized protein (DUF1778 family)